MIETAKVQVDPDQHVTVHATLLVDGQQQASDNQTAVGDVTFQFGSVAVHAGQSVTLSLTMSADYGKIITVYEAGSGVPGGRLVVADSCTDGATNVDTTITALRATVTGMSA